MFSTLKQWRCWNNMLISIGWLRWYLNEDDNHPINPRHYHLRLTSPINSLKKETKSSSPEWLFSHFFNSLFARFFEFFFYTIMSYRWENTYRDAENTFYTNTLLKFTFSSTRSIKLLFIYVRQITKAMNSVGFFFILPDFCHLRQFFFCISSETFLIYPDPTR